MANEDAATTPEQEPEQGSPDQPQPEQAPQDRASREGPQPEPQQGEQGKIHADADWKAEAKAEKQRLARDTAEAAGGPTAGPGPAGAGRPGRLPAPSFTGLVQTLATQVIIFLSNEQDPETGRTLRNLDLAKHNIDLLGVLEEKTRGNLTDEEKRLLNRYLYELRMAYVAAAS